MGGQSFRCPLCYGDIPARSEWFMTKAQLADHLRGKHKLKNFRIDGVATTAIVITKESRP